MIVGGTGLSGPHLVADLAQSGCDVAVVHRGLHERPMPAAVTHIHVDEHASAIRVERRHVEDFKPDVIVHMVAITGSHVEELLNVASDLVSRVVVVSSIDVYRAYGRLHRTEPGDPDPTPLAEGAPLRTRHGPEGEAHEKLDVERVLMTASAVDGTVVRYPAVYGPGDRRRMSQYIKRMVDQRPCVLLDETMSPWRFSRGFSRNVAHAVASAVLSSRAAGEVYNVADWHALTEREWVEAIASRVGWAGSIVELPRDRLPAELRQDLDFRQHWVVDSSKIRAELGFDEPTAFDDAISATVEWELAHPPRGWSIDYGPEDQALVGW